MSSFQYNNQELYIERVALSEIARQFGTPCYVYSKKAISNNWMAFLQALRNSNLSFKIHYAVKANSNLSILKLLASLGAGFDVVSGGEMERVLAAGGNVADMVFSGVGKSYQEIKRAIELNICSIHIESEQELLRVHEIAKNINKTANIAIRVNPDIYSDSHPYISTGSKNNKFGVDYDKSLTVYQQANKLSHIAIKGIACHIGSQITSLEPFLSAIDQLLTLIKSLADNHIHLEYIDVGGGLGVCYKDETPPLPKKYIDAIVDKIKHTKLELYIEPGRSIVANSGAIITKVEYLKTTADNHFAIVDVAMNDLLRPSLYQSFHQIVPLQQENSAAEQNYAVVGPICESGDFLGTSRKLRLNAGDLLAIKDCGAYGFSMSSNYNTRPRCPEILVDDTKFSLIRKRETIEQLLENEIL
jgi:diaminopimelate decarboxylase